MMKQVHGCGMPKNVGRYPLFPERSAVSLRHFDVFVEYVPDTVTAQSHPTAVGEQGGGTVHRNLAKPLAQSTGGLLPQWGTAFFASFAFTSYVCTAAEVKVLPLEPSEFRDAKASLDRKQ